MHDPFFVRGRETLGHPAAGGLHRLALRERVPPVSRARIVSPSSSSMTAYATPPS